MSRSPGVGTDAVVLAVADRGLGVPADTPGPDLRALQQAGSSRSQGSSGLGLAIAAEHAAILGGHLEASVRDGGGLRVVLVAAGGCS